VNNARLSVAILVVTDESSAPRSVAVVSDRRLSVAALAALLIRDDRYVLGRVAQGGDDVRAALETDRPAVLVVESTWYAWVAAVRPREWDGRTLLLLDPEDELVSFAAAIRTGCDGYLSRAASGESLHAAIDSLLTVGYYLDPVLVGKILWSLKESTSTPIAASVPLSQRENDILIRIANGQSSKEIAREYDITPKTVANHVNNMYAKLHLRDRGQLVLYALERGLVNPVASLAGGPY
jgi:two-component system nitrate/nitrite response regulator NarL